MDVFKVPVINGNAYLKFAHILFTGPALLFNRKIEEGSIHLTERELKQWFLNAIDGFDFPYINAEAAFPLYPAQAGEPEGEYIQFELVSPKYQSMRVRFRFKVEAAGQKEVKLTAHALSKKIEGAINNQLYELYS